MVMSSWTRCYCLKAQAKWDKITDQVIAIIQALVKEGHACKKIAIYGDSAGGGLTAGAVLKMRDLCRPKGPEESIRVPGLRRLQHGRSADVDSVRHKEIFLSNAVRHYQALDNAGISVKLDPYESRLPGFQLEPA